MKTTLEKIKKSFILICKGKEKSSIVLYFWGIPLLIAAIFISYPIANMLTNSYARILMTIIIVLISLWHIVSLIRCRPVVTKEEKIKLKKEKKGKFLKSLGRKLILKEPITKPRPILAGIAANLYFIIDYINYGFF